MSQDTTAHREERGEEDKREGEEEGGGGGRKGEVGIQLRLLKVRLLAVMVGPWALARGQD